VRKLLLWEYEREVISVTTRRVTVIFFIAAYVLEYQIDDKEKKSVAYRTTLFMNFFLL
jgi:hypothetical protein